MSGDVTRRFGYDCIFQQVAAGQIASAGMVALSYVQRISEKCLLRGKIYFNGCVAAFSEERLNMGLNFIHSAEVGGIWTSLAFPTEISPLSETEVDPKKKDYKFGFGLFVGE
ncbi:hypothetical protein CQW23_13954 [Capsicum baccatum]|uniref:Uncharacterized protein n=1 Tax=Capsicum baccatum TaxID=33114 RepID=A0A2G2WHS3_CAPBA|nr:hypothetical protein CQW23_13954 [Capsicum baccatum]